MAILATRMSSVKPSPTLAMTAKAAQLRAQGVNVINLSVGEPDFDTPMHIKEAAIAAINEGHTKYTAVSGIRQLREAIARKLSVNNGLDYDVEQIIVSSGAKQVIFNAFMATLSDGDEVIIPAPYWVSYPDMVAIAGGSPVIVDCQSAVGLKLTPELLRRSITARTKWLVLNSPNNPTGAVYGQDELRALADVLLSHEHVRILSDDTYESIIFDGQRFTNIAQVEPLLRDRVLIVNGVSKAYAMTGWRIGYGAGLLEIVKGMEVVQSQSTSNASSISQYAALAALNGPQDIVARNSELFERRRGVVMSLLNTAHGIKVLRPSGAFYAFLDCSAVFGISSRSGVTIRSSSDFAEYLLSECRVVMVPGDGFGAEGYVRMSYAIREEDLREACERIIAACGALHV